MAILCKEHRLLYIQVPGTGCSVVGRVLREQFGGEELGRKHSDAPELLREGLLTEAELGDYLVVANIRNPFDRMVTYYQRLDGPWIDEYLAWARRNLERRLNRGEITEKEYRKRLAMRSKEEARKRRRVQIIRRVGFNLWLQGTLLRWRFNDRRRVPDEHGLRHTGHLFPMLDHVDVALRQEHLESALNAVLRRVGLEKDVRLPQRNLTAGKKPYAAYYNGISRRLIEQLYQRELAFFGYRFNGLMEGDVIVQLTGRVPQYA